MKGSEITSLREMLEQLSTHRLDEMLRAELQKETLDDNTVRLILDVLREREANYPVELTPGIQKAWENYRAAEDRAKADQTARKRVNRVLKAASVALVVGSLLFVVPQQAEAESFFDLLVRWTDSLFSFFGPGSEDSGELVYEFRTDNPGLQQVYDAVVEMGITEPVVPMWLPEGYMLVAVDRTSSPKMECISAQFTDGTKEIVIRFSCHNSDTPFEYHKDSTEVTIREIQGTNYYVIRNNERWVVTCRKDNLECAIYIDCREDELEKILWSIYTMEAE